MNNQKIFLVRHGETEWTITGQHTGLTDIPLTDKGKREAMGLKKELAGILFEKVFTSPLKRALETCQIAGFLPEAHTDPDLVEWNYGSYEGLTHKEIIARDPGWTIFSRGAPGGESVQQVSRRADRFLAHLKPYKNNILVFSSGHFFRTLAARFLQLQPSDGKLFLLEPASLSILAFEREDPVIASWNNLYQNL